MHYGHDLLDNRWFGTLDVTQNDSKDEKLGF